MTSNSQIKLPKGVSFVQLAHNNDTAVASIAKTRGGVSEAADEATPEATPEA